MLKEKMQTRANLTKEELCNSKLSVQEKEDLEEVLENSLAGTNGLTPDEKLQNVSESVFELVRLFIRARCEAKSGSWKEVIVRCKREIMWISFAFFGLLFFHPEIAAMLKGVAQNG